MLGKEREFSEGSTLISVTDLKGVIQYCNRDFIEMSGYSESELINANHNIIRHPDMPKAAFEDLWETIKADKPWQGMVKNRCKNGDYYWVEAYVTPVMQDGKKIGYQSVRSCPTRKQVDDATTLYQTLNNDPQRKLPKPSFLDTIKVSTKMNAIITAIFISFLLVQMSVDHLFSTDALHIASNLWVTLLLFLLLYIFNNDVAKPIQQLTRTIRRMASGNLTEHIVVSKHDEISRAIVSTKILQGRLKAVIGRFVESSHSLGIATDVLSEASYQTKMSMDRQHQETDLVATAMNEMSATVGEIAENTSKTSEFAGATDDVAQKGRQIVESTKNTILELSDDITNISETINLLAQECQQIREITSAISGIADQTNLLALNAAIEAARAGEHGRGFAVVADEVRGLSSSTQQSTVEINTMIEQLLDGSNKAVVAMEQGLDKVNQSVDKIQNTEEAFSEIVASITDVNDMNMQIATAAEEQSCVTEEMNTNVHSISVQSTRTNKNVEQLEGKIASLITMAKSLKLQVSQYDLGEPATQFDFEQAKTAHLSWKSKVRDFLRGDTNAITKAQVCSHRECMMGKWYYAEGMKKYSNSTYFKQIEAPHARLHAIVKEVFELYELGRLDEANELYNELAPLSDEIVELLDKTEASIK